MMLIETPVIASDFLYKNKFFLFSSHGLTLQVEIYSMGIIYLKFSLSVFLNILIFCN